MSSNSNLVVNYCIFLLIPDARFVKWSLRHQDTLFSGKSFEYLNFFLVINKRLKIKSILSLKSEGCPQFYALFFKEFELKNELRDLKIFVTVEPGNIPKRL